jgi:hypothetical protein
VKKQKEDVPLQYFERSYILLLLCFAALAGLAYITYVLIIAVNPWGFIVGIPTVILAFQTLWLVLNPYAVIYDDKFEIKKSFIHNKIWYYIDIKNVSESSGYGFDITYNDNDEEKITTAGIRSSHKAAFRNAVNHYVCKSLVERED